MTRRERSIRELLKDAPPMAEYYQRRAFEDAKRLRKARAIKGDIQ